MLVRNHISIRRKAMKLVIYNNSNVVVETIENIHLPKVEENNVEWEDGSLSGINLPFLLLGDEVVISNVITEEIKSFDKKEQFTKVDLVKENADLKARQVLMQDALDDLILGGGL
jgi:hypothetical protein